MRAEGPACKGKQSVLARRQQAGQHKALCLCSEGDRVRSKLK